MIDDDDIWTTSDADQPAGNDPGLDSPSHNSEAVAPDDYPTPDVDPGPRRFWTVGRVATVVAVAVIVGTVAYLIATRVGDDEEVNTSASMTTSEEISPTDLWGRTWEVTRLDMGTENPVPWSKGDTDTVLFLDLTQPDRVSFNGCNGASGNATLTGNVFKATDLVSTEMACPDPEGAQLMAYDVWMAAFLTEGVTVTFDDGTLVLTGPNGTARLDGPGDITAPPDSTDATEDPTATDAPDGPVSSDDLATKLWGSQWELSGITPADKLDLQPPVETADGSTPVVDTTETDRLNISGCNGTGGAVHLDGDKLVADGPWMQTKMACEPDLMDQEDFLTTFLEAGPTVSVEDDVLTLAGDGWLLFANRI